MNKHQKKKRSIRGRSSDPNTTDGHQTEDSDSCVDDASGPLRPYELRVSDEMGRYLVASRDLAPGDVLINEAPLVIGPCAGTDPGCLGCYRVLANPIPEDQYTCKNCGWPLCGPHCPGLHSELGHSTEECSALRETNSAKGLNLQDDFDLRDQYEAITPLRCLLLARHRPADWRIIKGMESHDALRRKTNPTSWDHNQKVVVDRIRDSWGLKHKYSENEIHAVCGALEVNSFEVGHFGARARALYSRAFLLAHDCTPNTTHADDPKTRRLTVRTARRVRQGELITLSYVETLQGTISRREHILESKFFSCNCIRCSDPTELGSYLSALRCPRCPKGLVLASAPLEPEAPWICTTGCQQYIIQARSIRLLMDRIQDELDSMECNDVPGLEDFLVRYRNVLYSDHYLRLAAKLRLSQLYGKIGGYLAQHLTREQLRRKQQLCEELMRVFDVLEPGLTRLRGITLYEWHAPIMILATRDFEAKKLSTEELRIRLKQVVCCLREAAGILSLEPPTSSEGIMAAAAKDALHRIKDWQKIIGKI